jgi:hypothetical protein
VFYFRICFILLLRDPIFLTEEGLDNLKQKLVTVPILIIPDWKKEFHVHVDASFVSLGAILAQPGEGDIDHPIAFARRKFLIIIHNYTTTECEGLTIMYMHCISLDIT